MKSFSACCLLATRLAAALAQVQTLQHKDAKRRYIVYTPPAYDSHRSRPFRLSSISTAAA